MLAARSCDLLSLESMEDESLPKTKHNMQLQDSEAHMLVRFMIEAFGPSSPFDTVREFEKADSTIEEALLSTTGLTYERFETEFREWIKKAYIHGLEIKWKGLESRYCYAAKALYKEQ